VLCGACVAEGREATVYTIDGQKLRATVNADSFAIRTDAGTLTVPTGEIVSMYPGFRAGQGTEKRIASYIRRLGEEKPESAARVLKQMGRVAIPQLQAAAAGGNKEIAKQAKTLLKEVWPSGAKVPVDGAAVLRTETAEFRGAFAWLTVEVEGTFGRKTLRRTAIQSIQFTRGKVQPAGDPPAYSPLKEGRYPALELILTDGTRILGEVDTYRLDIETPYGKLQLPVKELISIKLGDPDEIVTRDMHFTGKLSTATLEVKSKVGDFRVDRDKVVLVRTVLNEMSPAVVKTAVPGQVLPPNQWADLFNGKDLDDWSRWGRNANDIKLQDGTIHLSGDCGMSYHKADEIENVIVAAQVHIRNTQGGGGVKLILRDTAEGQYYLHFEGRRGFIAKWDNRQKKSTTLKGFRVPEPEGQWHFIQFGILDKMILGYVNGQPAGQVEIDPKNALPSGKVGLGVWNADANFRDIRAKVLE
jgi:hypothetical protein